MDELATFVGVGWLALAVAVLTTFAAASIQSTFGFGFAIVSVPLLSLVHPSLAPAPQILLALPLSLTVFLREREHADYRGAGRILIGALPGAALGALLLVFGSKQLNALAVAAIVLFAALVIARGLHVPKNRATEIGAGVLSSAFSVICGVDGPPLALLYHGARGQTLRATLALLFLVSGSLSIGVRTATGTMTLRDVAIALVCVPGLAAGLYVGRTYGHRIEGRSLRIGVLVLASLAAVGLAVRALTQ
jgi:uncharacterized membrane protein YfcA